MFRRKIMTILEEWKANKDKCPIIIKGLRQIGKTYIVSEFCKKNYENAYILDFRKQVSIHSIFDGDFNIDNIVSLISSLSDENKIIKSSKMIPYKTAIVFDELQDCPNARSSLKYFREDGRYDIICTGSLMGIKGYKITKEKSRGIAVGSEEQIEMKSMDFEEFLWANEVDDTIIEQLKQCLDEKKEAPALYHQQFLDWVNRYIVIGGLPDVVKKYIETKDYGEVRKIQKRIISNYESDFGTHLNDNNEIVVDEVERSRIMDVFRSIPMQLAKDNKKFMYSVISHHAKGRSHASSITWLRDYGLITLSHNLSLIDKPLDYFSIEEQFKVYMSDIGLLTAMLEKSTQYRVLTNDLDIGKGMIYENLISDALTKNDKKQYYYSKDSGLEIDFVIELEGDNCLVEVKATKGTTKSSNVVLKDSKNKVNKLLKLTSQNISLVDNKFTVPYYLAFYVLSK